MFFFSSNRFFLLWIHVNVNESFFLEFYTRFFNSFPFLFNTQPKNDKLHSPEFDNIFFMNFLTVFSLLDIMIQILKLP